jgi:hypothetical protein
MLNCRMGCFSFEAQKKQNACQQRGFSAAQAFAHKAEKTWAATFRPLLRTLIAYASGKNCYALPTLVATIVFSAFGRSFFADRGLRKAFRVSVILISLRLFCNNPPAQASTPGQF